MMKDIREWLKKYTQEKRTITWNAFGLATLFFVIWSAPSFFSGSASAGPKNKQKAVLSIEEFHKELSKNLNQLSETLASLNQLAKTEEGDLYKPYKNFVKQLNRTTENSRNMSKHTKDMATKGRQYFDTWEKELLNVINSELRAKGEERRGELSKTFNHITNLAEEVQTMYQPFIIDLTDIKTALGNDLTTTGILSLNPYITKANKNAKIVMIKLQELADEVDRATNALSSRAGL